jgi:hypothetical protein
MTPSRLPQAAVPPNNAGETPPKATIYPKAGLEAVRQRRLAQIPARYRPVFLRVWKGKSRKAAIRAFCLECIGYEAAAEIARCSAPACPLWPYREKQA